jgi:hypothetical protein
VHNGSDPTLPYQALAARASVNGQPPVPALDEVIEVVEILRDLLDRFGDDNLHRLPDAL